MVTVSFWHQDLGIRQEAFGCLADLVCPRAFTGPESRHSLPGLPTYTEIRSTRLRETSLPRRS